MERSESEPDSADGGGERAKRRDARYMNSRRKWLGTSSSSGSQCSNWGSLASSQAALAPPKAKREKPVRLLQVETQEAGRRDVRWQMNP